MKTRGTTPITTPILVSACLLGEKCRYNGKGYQLPFLEKSLRPFSILPVCPEVLGGLPVPRPPCELKNGDGYALWQGEASVITENGQDCTGAFQEGARKTWAMAEKAGVKLAILKDRSPSCGCHQIYDGSFRQRLVDGVGVTASLLQKMGIKVMAETDWLAKRRDNFV